jgi:4-diphosphocytidyl-2-C-methyl-D-erythritol kinase
LSGPETVRAECPAKVNLFLEVRGRREDGFHEIETVFKEIRLCDSLSISPAAGGIDITVEGAELPEGEGNLVVRAARSYLDRFGGAAGLRIRLTKRIPLMAGLGGGSSDAAATLRALRDLLHPDQPADCLAPLAEELGSDVPFFLRGGTAHATGRGEQLRWLAPGAPFWVALAFPPFGLATKRVYGAVRVPPPSERRAPDLLLEALRSGGDPGPTLFNRLEEAALAVAPEAAVFRAVLRRLLLPGEQALLSGSGSTFFVPARYVSRATELAKAVTASGIGRGLAVRTA